MTVMPSAVFCLIRLENIRPRGFPTVLGLSSENAAHRIAVVWEDDAGVREGVFESGSVGYSATASGQKLDGVVLMTESWSVAPLGIERAHSSYFEDSGMFPVGSIDFDCALIMRNTPHEWEATTALYL